MRTTTTLLTLLAGASFAGTAMAGGLQEPAPTPVIAPAPIAVADTDWTGFYFGGQVGGSDVDTSGAANVDGDGAFFGLHAGYN